jgi:hypothetical protein
MDKVKRLESLQNSKKAVFIGGSASHFGIHVEQFQAETWIPSVNMALHAGGSFKMYLDNILPFLKTGDIVFLCPEYEYYSSNFDEISDESIDLIYMSNPIIFKNTKFSYKIKSIPETLITGWRHLGNVIKYNLASLAETGYKEKYLGDYRRDYSNEYGDYAGIKDLPNRDFITDHSIVYKDKMFMDKLQEYINFLAENGVEIYFLFPPGDNSLFENSKAEIDKIYSKVISAKNIKILYAPQQVIYNDDYFFNTFYHLNYTGAIAHTKYIIEKYKNKTRE